MANNKLAKFADMATYKNVFQYSFKDLQQSPFPLRGRWGEKYFKNNNPIVLELGCGKGEYTVGLAKNYPNKNFIGIDIKGARMWTGATEAIENKLNNVAFVRTRIEAIANFFESDEVSEIWLTFPEPQMKRENRRLTSCRFMRAYGKILKENALIHLKTDSHFLYTYTKALIKENQIELLFDTNNLYKSEIDNKDLAIQTFYERVWISRGCTIKYLRYLFSKKNEWVEPSIEIERDNYRSFSRIII